MIKSINRIKIKCNIMKRRYNSNEARQDILNAGEKLFAEKGFGEVSTSELAKAAGVSQSQIHYHFGTKRKLWEAVFNRKFSEYYEVQSATLDNPMLEDVQRLEASIRVYFSFFKKNPRFVKLLARAQVEGLEEEDNHQCFDLKKKGIATIKEAQNKGILRDDIEPEFVILGFLSLVAYWFQSRDQFLLQCGLTEDPQNYDEVYLDFIIKIFLKGITPEK